MQVKFVDAQEVRDGEGVVIQKFKAGQVAELSAASARHWINRGLALDVRAAAQEAREARKVTAEAVAEEGDSAESADPSVEAAPAPGVATAKASPTPPKRGRGRPRSV